tara:strand:- start:325 stop:1038 length:714 start_codon:yes stop_codon:yes gene_type:complete
MSNPNKSGLAPGKILLVVLLAGLTAAFFYFDVHQYLSFQYLKDSQADFQAYYQSNPSLTLGLFFLVYVAVTALSVPGAAILTLAAGALFGLAIGTLLVSFASSIGATLAFLSARYLFRDYVQDRFGSSLKTFNEGFKKEGGFYLFSMRLLPVFPFFMINLITGLTPLKTSTFYLVSQVGMLAGTLVYVNAGTQLAQIDSLSGIVSPELIASFAALGLFPIAAKKLIGILRTNKEPLT